MGHGLLRVVLLHEKRGAILGLDDLFSRSSHVVAVVALDVAADEDVVV